MKFNVKSYLTRPIIGCFVIGLLIGGLTLGIVDSKRPQPLFSSADPFDDLPIECVGTVQQIADFADWVEEQVPVRPDIYEGWQGEYQRLADNVLSCIHNICDELNTAYTSATAAWSEARIAFQIAEMRANLAHVNAEIAYTEFEAAMQVYDDAYSEYVSYQESLIPPITASQQAQLNHLASVRDDALAAQIAAEENYNNLDELEQAANLELEAAEEAEDLAETANNEAHQAYTERNCDTALSWTAPGLISNSEPPYQPTPTPEPPEYEEDPSSSITPTPTPTPGRGKDDAAGTGASIKALIPKIPNSDTTRAY